MRQGPHLPITLWSWPWCVWSESKRFYHITSTESPKKPITFLRGNLVPCPLPPNWGRNSWPAGLTVVWGICVGGADCTKRNWCLSTHGDFHFQVVFSLVLTSSPGLRNYGIFEASFEDVHANPVLVFAEQGTCKPLPAHQESSCAPGACQNISRHLWKHLKTSFVETKLFSLGKNVEQKNLWFFWLSFHWPKKASWVYKPKRTPPAG